MLFFEINLYTPKIKIAYIALYFHAKILALRAVGMFIGSNGN